MSASSQFDKLLQISNGGDYIGAQKLQFCSQISTKWVFSALDCARQKYFSRIFF